MISWRASLAVPPALAVAFEVLVKETMGQAGSAHHGETATPVMPSAHSPGRVFHDNLMAVAI
jgi:hypothetical protein